MAQDIRLIQLNSFNRPEVEELKTKGYVLNGRNNEYYKYIIDRYNGSVTNATIINSYIDLTYGKGIGARNARTNPKDWLRFKTILKDKDIRKMIADFTVFNEFSFQVIKAKNKKDLGSILHLPKERVVPAIENEDEEIEQYFYSKDFCKLNKYPAMPFPAYGFGSEKAEIEIYVGRPYKVGKTYFSDPLYKEGFPYCEMEQEIANYYVSHIKNGLSFGYIINIPDGKDLTSEEKDEIERKIKLKLTGSSNAGKFVLSFNGRDAEITVTPLQVNDSHKQWTVLNEESRDKIMMAHRVVSPMLFGIKDSTGLGNNADELDTAEAQTLKRVIAPRQNFILDCLKEVLVDYGINLELYFKPLTDEVSVAMNSHNEDNLDGVIADELISLGENITDEWELIDSQEFHFASTGTAIPNAKSEIDGNKFKSRLRYTGTINSNSREFCRKMISANKLYRIEDINKMSKQVVNAGFGANGSNTYDILLYKGGARCKHYWTRETYQLKADVNNPNAKEITPSEARKEGEILPSLDKKVYEKPNNMPNNGFINKR